jgi:hypothetical protein
MTELARTLSAKSNRRDDLPNGKRPPFEIPFSLEAAFCGNRDDLFEFHPEMWSHPA